MSVGTQKTVNLWFRVPLQILFILWTYFGALKSW